MTSAIAHRANAMLVIISLVAVVLPAVLQHAMTAIMLMAATPPLWLAYICGWWGLLALLRIFASFILPSVQIGSATILGLAAGAIAVVGIFSYSFVALQSCATCSQVKLLAYRPGLFCLGVTAHWVFLHSRNFRFSRGNAHGRARIDTSSATPYQL